MHTLETDRIKKEPGYSINSWWWLRSASTGSNFYLVASDGSYNSLNVANTLHDVVLGFCL